MEQVTVFLGIFTAILHGIAYVLYNIQTSKGSSKPNAISWSIWAFLSILNALSYREMSGNWIMTLQFFTGSIACLFTFLRTLFIGKFVLPKKWYEWSVFVLCITALVYWRLKDATGANYIVTLAFMVSFIPTFVGVLYDPFKETPRSWALWTIAFFITIINVVLLKGKFSAYIAPSLLLVAHFSIVLLSSKKRKRDFANK